MLRTRRHGEVENPIRVKGINPNIKTGQYLKVRDQTRRRYASKFTRLEIDAHLSEGYLLQSTNMRSLNMAALKQTSDLETILRSELLPIVRWRNLLAIFNCSKGSNQSDGLISLLNRQSPNRVSALDNQIRNTTNNVMADLFARDYLWSYDRSLKCCRKIVTARRSTAIIFTTSWSGHVREYALNSILRIDGPFELALIIRRLNDWVPEVRASALQAFERVLVNPGNNQHDMLAILIGCFGLVMRAARTTREEGFGELALQMVLTYNGFERYLIDFIKKSKEDLAPKCLRLSLQSGYFHGILEDLAQSAAHASTRRIAVQAILRGGISWRGDNQLNWQPINQNIDKDCVVGFALNDSSSEVQKTALQYLIETPESVHHNATTYEHFMAHRLQSISNRAVFGYKALGLNIDTFLRSTIEKSHIPPIWAVRLLSRNGGNLPEIKALYEKAPIKPDVRWLGLLAQMGDFEADKLLFDLAINSDNHSIARSAVSNIYDRKNTVVFDTILNSAKFDKGFVTRGLTQLLEAASVVQILCVAAALNKQGITEKDEVIWGLVNRKRNRGVFEPNDTELQILSVESDGLTEFRIRAQKSLGISVQ